MIKSSIIPNLVILLVSAGCKQTPKYDLEKDLFLIYSDLEDGIRDYYFLYLEYPKSVDEIIKYQKLLKNMHKDTLDEDEFEIDQQDKVLSYLKTNKNSIHIDIKQNYFHLWNSKDDARLQLERNYCFNKQDPWAEQFYYHTINRYVAFNKSGQFLWEHDIQVIKDIEAELRQKYPIEVTTEVNGETVPRLIVFKYDKKGSLIIPCEEDSDLDFRNDPYLKDLLSLLDNYFSKYKKAHSIRILTGLRK